MAKGNFRGCVYIVWYTPDVPASFGPWKLNGCPGLILEAIRTDNGLSFYATKIDNGKYIEANIGNNPDKTVPYAEYRQSRIDFYNKFSEKIVTQGSRNSDEQHIIPLFISCMECDFIDEIKRYPTISIRKISTSSIPESDF
jgi:hypothetical protein